MIAEVSTELRTSSVRDDLSDHFQLLRYQLQRYLHRKGQRLLHGNSGVAVEEIAATLGLSPQPEATTLSSLLQLPNEDEIDKAAFSVQSSLNARRAHCRTEGWDLPFDTVQAAFRLSNIEIAFLTAQLASQVDLDLQRLLRLAWADFAQKQPTAGFLMELVANTPADYSALRLALRPRGTLRRHGLIELLSAEGWRGEAPLPQRVVMMPDRLAEFLQLGLVAQEEQTPNGIWRFEPPSGDPGTSDEDWSIPPAEGARVAAESALGRRIGSLGQPVRLVLYGQPGSGRLPLIRELARAEGCGLVVIQLDRILRAETGPSLETPSDSRKHQLRFVSEALREAVLHNGLVYLAGAEMLDAELPSSPVSVSDLLTLLSDHPQRLVLSATQPITRLRQAFRNLVEIEVPVLTPSKQAALWHGLLAGEMNERLVATLAEALSQQYTLTPGSMQRILAQAKTQAGARPRGKASKLRPADVLSAVQRQFHHRLGHLAQRLRTPLSWDDLILPPKLRERLKDIVKRMKHRERVLDEWGFRHKLSRGRGLSCMFSGPPGTGKTMAAELVAKAQGMEVYRVDLSRVVDKYIGETEKNLGRLFDEAERAQAVLLFDEADSLFGKRTKVSSSNDRYANLEVNYLLQRIETFEGVCILTTNFEAAIDDAFKRRLTFRLSFPMPDADARAQIWAALLPTEAAQECEIDWELLADAFEFSGGHIKNSVVRAAYDAAEREEPISTDNLYRAGVQECGDIGVLIRDLPLERLRENRRRKGRPAQAATPTLRTRGA